MDFGEVKVETRGEQHVFVHVCLNDLDPKAVLVELYADGVAGSAPVRQEMDRIRQPAGASGGNILQTVVSAVRPPADFLIHRLDTEHHVRICFGELFDGEAGATRKRRSRESNIGLGL